MRVKGMVQLFGVTYRVVRLQMGRYQVVRIHDEAVVGLFCCGVTLEVTALGIDVALMRQVAALAVQRGKTSWMGPRVTAEPGSRERGCNGAG